MAKSKYTPERVERILEAIKQQGGDRAGWEAGGISKDTFYKWITDFPDFSDSIAHAKEEFRRTCPKYLTAKARRSLSDYLFEGNIIKREKTGESVKIIEDADGNVKAVERLTYTEQRIDRMPTPQWVIDRLLGKPVDELEAIKVLVEAGWFPPEILNVGIQGMDDLRRLMQLAVQGLPPPEKRRLKQGNDETVE